MKEKADKKNETTTVSSHCQRLRSRQGSEAKEGGYWKTRDHSEKMV